ncbi:hypothetical protein GEMRC1_004162 [Eukaryota sp. GEM-RC1]
MTDDFDKRASSFANFLSDNASTVSLSASRTFEYSTPTPHNHKDIIERARRRIEILKERSLTAENEVSRLQQKVMALEGMLSGQKDQYESKISHEKSKLESYLKKISTVLEEKERLSKDLESALTSIEQLKHDMKKKLSIATEHSKKESERAALAARTHERHRCDKIMQKKIQEVRESTVKGIEPELARLISNHKDSERRLKEEYEREVAGVKSQFNQRLASEVEEIRKSLTDERLAALERERELSRHKISTLQDRHDDEINELRRRHREEVTRILAENRLTWTNEENEQFKRFETERAAFVQKESKLMQKLKIWNWRLDLDSKVNTKVAQERLLLIEEKDKEVKELVTKQVEEKLEDLVGELEKENLEIERELAEQYRIKEEQLKKENESKRDQIAKERSDWRSKYELIVEEKSRLEGEISEHSKVLEQKITDFNSEKRN